MAFCNDSPTMVSDECIMHIDTILFMKYFGAKEEHIYSLMVSDEEDCP